MVNGKWHPIETVPRDGKEYLVVKLYDKSICYHVIYYQSDNRFHVNGDYYGELDTKNPADFGNYWTKLPKPPKGIKYEQNN